MRRAFCCDTSALERGDILKRFQAYKLAIEGNFMQADEIRYKEDMPALGLNWIRLGLDDVLYDPKTQLIYTPNTNAYVKMGDKRVEAENDDENRSAEYRQEIHGPDGKIIDNKPDGGGSSTGSSSSSKAEGKSEKSVDKSAESDIISLEDEYISKSLGAKRKNYDVKDLRTGEHFDLVEGTYIRNKEIFAGKGSSSPYRRAYVYANRYHNSPEEWSHVKGIGTIDYYGEERNAELHWSECKEFGKVDIFVKEWLD